MAKVLDLKKTVFELVQENPEVVEVLSSIGLTDVKNPTVLNTVGKQFTIPQGVGQRGVSLETVIAAFRAHGFEIKE